ncbi:MAG: hypothetical protein R3E57_09195 [Porticoccaceae bacterium]
MKFMVGSQLNLTSGNYTRPVPARTSGNPDKLTNGTAINRTYFRAGPAGMMAACFFDLQS